MSPAPTPSKLAKVPGVGDSPQAPSALQSTQGAGQREVPGQPGQSVSAGTVGSSGRMAGTGSLQLNVSTSQLCWIVSYCNWRKKVGWRNFRAIGLEKDFHSRRPRVDSSWVLWAFFLLLLHVVYVGCAKSLLAQRFLATVSPTTTAIFPPCVRVAQAAGTSTPSKMTRTTSGGPDNHNHNLNVHTPQRPQQVRNSRLPMYITLEPLGSDPPTPAGRLKWTMPHLGFRAALSCYAKCLFS